MGTFGNLDTSASNSGLEAAATIGSSSATSLSVGGCFLVLDIAKLYRQYEVSLT